MAEAGILGALGVDPRAKTRVGGESLGDVAVAVLGAEQQELAEATLPAVRSHLLGGGGSARGGRAGKRGHEEGAEDRHPEKDVARSKW